MAIHIEVLAELERRSIEKAARELDTKFHDRRIEVGADVKATEIKAAAAKIQKEFSDIRAEIKVDVDPRAAKQLRDVEKAGRSATNVIQELGMVAFRTSRGLLTLGAPVAVAGLLEVAQVGTAATQALWLLPAAASAAAAGIGTLAIATHGFGDAIKDMGDPKKFAEGLALLSPNAQQAALAIKSLVDGPLGELKKATQDNFFAGLSDQFQNLSRIYVPEIRKMTTGIAGAFNEAMQGVGNLLATPTAQGQLSTTMANITQAFQNAAPAAQSLSQAFIDISEVGSSFLPGFGTSIANAADQFANFISEARQSGDLAKWIQQGIDAVKNLGTAVSELVQIFYRVFGPGATDGINNVNTGMSSLDQTVQSYNADLTKTADIIGLLSLDTHTWSMKWNEEMMAMQGPLGALRDGILDIPEAFMFLVNKVIDAMNTMGKNAHGFFDRLIPFSDLPAFEPIPNVGTGGDWGGYRDTGAPPRARRNRAGQPIGSPPSTGPSPPGGSIFSVPPVPPDGAGGKPSQKERRDAIIAGLDPSLWQVDPFGGMAGMQMGPGANPQDVLEQQRNVISEAHDLEEATKNRLALERDNTATAQDIDEAKWKEVEEGWQLQEAQVKLAEKMAGTAKDVKSGADELSAALDPDLGLGKGLAGLADNLVRFIGHLAAAPMMAKLQTGINANAAATGIQGGYGMLGMMGAQNLSQGLSPLLGRPMPGMGPASTGGNYQSAYNPSGGMYPSSTAAAGALPPSAMMPVDTGQTRGYAGLTPAAKSLEAVLRQQFPMLGDIGGQENRPPGTPQGHTKGLALDINIPNWDTPAGNALGDQINEFLQSNAGQLGLQQTIWENIGTEFPGGGKFNEPGHMNHIHAAVQAALANRGGGGAAAPNAPSGGWSADWNAIAQKESSGNWAIDSGNGYQGGLQFAPSSWEQAGGTQYAPSANLATPYQQAMTAEELLKQQGPGAWPNTFTPGSSGPGGGYGITGGPGASGGPRGPMFGPSLGPGTGIGGAIGQVPPLGRNASPDQPGTQIGAAVEPPSSPGGAGGFGIEPGGTIDTAIGVAASAADMFAPGAGQAMQTGMKLASRAIQYGGQMAGIGVSGLMETFLPTGGSELANNSWLTKIAGGIAAASPQLPNMAGKEGQAQPPLTPGQVAGQTDPLLGGFQNTPVNVTYNNNGATEDRAGKDLAHHLGQINNPGPVMGRR